MIQSQLYRYNYSDSSNDDRIDDIIAAFVSENKELENSQYLHIIDPYFNPENFFLETINHYPVIGPRDFMSMLFEFNDYFPNITSVKVVTCTRFDKILNRRDVYKYPPQSIGSTKNYFSVEKSGISYEFVYYKDPDKGVLNNPDIPKLHDRWLLWGTEGIHGGIHFGCSFNDFYRKDVTVTLMPDYMADDINKRYLELFCIGKVRK